MVQFALIILLQVPVVILILGNSLYASAGDNNSPANVDASDDVWWTVTLVGGHPKHQMNNESSLMLSFNHKLDPRDIHSCYNYKLVHHISGTITMNGSFCYPRVIIAGEPKAGTSALFELLYSHPNATAAKIKENCIFHEGRNRNLVEFFQSLSHPTHEIATNARAKVFVDGCIHPDLTMPFRTILRDPKVFYILITRDMKELLWSRYRYFADRRYADDPHTPEAFAARIEEAKGTIPPPEPWVIPDHICTRMKTWYREKVESLIRHNITMENLAILPSELLLDHPELFWSQLATKLNLTNYFRPDAHPGIEGFSTVLINVGRSSSNSASWQAAKADVGNHTALYYVDNNTREFIDACWQDDCMFLYNSTGYRYEACRSRE